MNAPLSSAEKKWAALNKYGRPQKRGPGLTTVNGIGNVVGGALHDPDLGTYHLRSVWFMLAVIPLFLVGIYLTSYPEDKKGRVKTNAYYFHSKISFEGIRAAMGKGAVSKIIWASAKSYLLILVAIISVIVAIFVVGFMMAKPSGG